MVVTRAVSRSAAGACGSGSRSLRVEEGCSLEIPSGRPVRGTPTGHSGTGRSAPWLPSAGAHTQPQRASDSSGSSIADDRGQVPERGIAGRVSPRGAHRQPRRRREGRRNQYSRRNRRSQCSRRRQHTRHSRRWRRRQACRRCRSRRHSGRHPRYPPRQRCRQRPRSSQRPHWQRWPHRRGRRPMPRCRHCPRQPRSEPWQRCPRPPRSERCRRCRPRLRSAPSRRFPLALLRWAGHHRHPSCRPGRSLAELSAAATRCASTRLVACPGTCITIAPNAETPPSLARWRLARLAEDDVRPPTPATCDSESARTGSARGAVRGGHWRTAGRAS